MKTVELFILYSTWEKLSKIALQMFIKLIKLVNLSKLIPTKVLTFVAFLKNLHDTLHIDLCK